MTTRTTPVYLNDPEGNPVQVGWAATPYEDIVLFTEGEGAALLAATANGPAQGFTFGE